MTGLLRLDGKVEPRVRRVALILVLLVQSVMFVALLPRPVRVLADNDRYEEAGWELATGHGLSLTDAVSADEGVRHWVRDRHPEACMNGIAPTAMYPPGYQVFIAGIYRVTGRSPAALAAANWVVLLALFVLVECLAARMLPPLGYGFVMLVSATYPFFAAQATVLMSDSLHATLLLGSLAALLLVRPGLLRGAMFGLFLAAATLTRPYCMFVVLALFVWRPLHRALDLRWREWLVAALLCATPFVAWTARNAYWFGRFIPFSTTGVGVTLFATALEIDGNDIYTAEGKARYFTALGSLHRDPMSYDVDQEFLARAEKIFEEHPGGFGLRVVNHAPKLWVSLGREGQGISRAWPLLVVYLGGLMVLGFAGIWLTRRDGIWHALSITVLVNWLFLLPMPGEARRTLPLRMPMLLLGAVAVVAIVRWWKLRGSRS